MKKVKEWWVEPHNISFPCSFYFMIVAIGLVFQFDIISVLSQGMVV